MDSHAHDLLHHKDHDLLIDGINILVKNGVFSPDPQLTHSTSMVWSKAEGETQRLAEKCIAQAPGHLNEGGKIYLAWSSLRNVQPIKQLLTTSKFHVTEYQEDMLGCTWYLFELTKVSYAH